MTDFIDDFPDDWTNRFEQKMLHVVCVAAGGFTACDCCASTIGNIKHEEVWAFTMKVNSYRETGTFWPRYPLTVVPTPYWEGRLAPMDLQGFYRKCFLDVALINRLHVKQQTMLVDLNGYSVEYDCEIARPIAEDVLSQEHSIETVYFVPHSNPVRV